MTKEVETLNKRATANEAQPRVQCLHNLTNMLS